MLFQYSEAGVRPSFTVQAVGPVTDFGELVCESIRQFLLHKQRQQQQQQQAQATVPWRGAQDFVSQNSVVESAQSSTPATPVQRPPFPSGQGLLRDA